LPQPQPENSFRFPRSLRQYVSAVIRDTYFIAIKICSRLNLAVFYRIVSLSNCPIMTNSLTDFRTDEGEAVPSISVEGLRKLIGSLTEEFLIPQHVYIESASLAFSMVVRSALGLTASQASVCALVSDNLSGQICLATLRMLSNAGAQPVVILLDNPDSLSKETETLLKTLDKLEIPLVSQFPTPDLKELEQLLSQTHAVLCGTSTVLEQPQSTAHSEIYSILNEIHTPIHSVLAPPGFCAESQKVQGDALLCSSTLSLGVPLAGLSLAKDFVGRHYLCDIQVPCKKYRELFGLQPGWFARQPVIQIFNASENALS